jgi:S1-C subfamily serine protease
MWIKLGVIGLAVIVMALAVGVIFAQDTTTASAYLGVRLSEQDGAVEIARVSSNSPAETAGLQEGDVLVSLNGQAVTAASEVVDIVDAAAPGDVLSIELLRADESVTVEVTLGSDEDRAGRGARTADPLHRAERLLDVELSAVEAGYEVVSVDVDDNPFALEVGDIVTALNGQAIADLDLSALRDEMGDAESITLALTVTRGDETVTLEADSIDLGRGFGGGRGDGDGRGGRGGFRGGSTDDNGEQQPEVTPEASQEAGQA